MQYDDDFLEQINEEVDLLEYVENYIPLKKRGSDYFGHCPLHIDKTPSFSITPEKNRYYCFGCGRGGGIISYLMEYEGHTFDDAVQRAAALAHVDMSQMCKSETIAFLKKYSRIKPFTEIQKVNHKILDWKESFYDKYEKAPIPEWEMEGIKKEEIELFQIRIDPIGNRIVYPVCDAKGNLINVKGRTRYLNYKDMKISKYMNYYKIGVMDYFQSLELALPYIQERKEVIIFESIKSVMKCFGWGYKNCISAEKHTLTTEQIMLLIRLNVDIVFAYDSDVDYSQRDVWDNLTKLKRIRNVYVLKDRRKLLGVKEEKNSPADCGKDIFVTLYNEKTKIV